MILEKVNLDNINLLSPFDVIYITAYPINTLSKISSEVLMVPYFQSKENKNLYKGYYYISKRIRYQYFTNCF